MVNKSRILMRFVAALLAVMLVLGIVSVIPHRAYGTAYVDLYENNNSKLAEYEANANELVEYIENSTTKLHVVDMANILTDSEEARLIDKCKEASENCKTDIVIITMKTGKDYSEFDNFIRDILESNYGYEGTGTNSEAIIYGIDMISRADRIITSGRTRSDISQSDLDSIRVDAEEELAEGDYYDGCVNFINGVERQMNDSFIYKFFLFAPGKALIAAIISLVSVLVMWGNSKTKITVDSNTYSNRRIKVHRQEDRYVNTTVTRRTIQSSSSGGRSGGGGGGNSGSSGGHF